MNMDLRFDDMVVDTTLAQNFVQKDETLSSIINGTSNTSFSKDYELTQQTSHDLPTIDLEEKLRCLVEKLKDHAEFFAQIEYLYRKIPIEDTKTQINIIVKQIQYVSCHINTTFKEVANPGARLIFSDDSPLLVLGIVARLILIHGCFDIVCKMTNTVAVSYLFVRLCHEVGLNVGMRFKCDEKREKTIFEIPYDDFIPIGANGVVTEHSDIDSAVDVFLTSSIHVPWRLQRILVQESIYQQFKDAVTWKCNLKQHGDGKNSNILEYNGRRFLVDPVETAQPLHNQVIVEAYRTTKELISLLRQHQLHYLSLWSNDVAESNEIAHSVPSPVVWVNGFGDFRGPPKVSEAIFSHIPYKISYKTLPVKESDVNGLVKVQQAWLKLDLETRRETLCKGLLECASMSDAESSTLKEIKKQLQLDSSNTFVDVGNDYICTGISIPKPKVYSINTNIINAGFFLAVLHGFAFVTGTVPLVDIFKKAGVPISSFAMLKDSDYSLVNVHISNIVDFYINLQRIKVIWTNSGTIFAN